jgi:hypothetical protein
VKAVQVESPKDPRPWGSILKPENLRQLGNRDEPVLFRLPFDIPDFGGYLLKVCLILLVLLLKLCRNILAGCSEFFAHTS